MQLATEVTTVLQIDRTRDLASEVPTDETVQESSLSSAENAP